MQSHRIGFLTSLLLLSATAVCLAQPAPPPEVDQALRARIAGYFQAHVDKKYRLAEPYIAEENKDDFYNSAKTNYLSFSDSKIDYSDNFTKAVVHTPTDMIWKVAQLGEMKLKKIVESYWKLVDGQWFWYQDDTNKGMMVPFGPDGKPVRMHPGPSVPDAGKPENVSDRITKFDRSNLAKVELKGSQVHLSRTGGTSEEVTVKNNMSGVIVVLVDHSDLPGLDVAVVPSQLKPGETAKVVFTYRPPKPELKPEVNATLRVQATQQTFPLSVVFADDAPAKTAAK